MFPVVWQDLVKAAHASTPRKSLAVSYTSAAWARTIGSAWMKLTPIFRLQSVGSKMTKEEENLGTGGVDKVIWPLVRI